MRTSFGLAVLCMFPIVACSSSSDAPVEQEPGGTGGAPPAVDASPSEGSADVEAAAPKVVWDWNGVIGTGQSLSVGGTAGVVSTTQPFHNLKLSLGSASIGTPTDHAPPYNADDPALSMVPLVEPIRPDVTIYPQAYPGNIDGETPHTAMANQLTALYQKGGGVDYVTVHTVVGESGQPMSIIDKAATPSVDGKGGTLGHAYAATLFEVAAITRLAKAAGKTYGVAAIILTHGESDAGNGSYESDMYQLLKDYNADIAAITGQATKIQLMVTQQQTVAGRTPETDTFPVSTAAVWQAGVDHPGEIICVGPKYQYTYSSDHLHLPAAGYDRLGEKNAEVYYERIVLGHDWQPLQPIKASRNGKVITVQFHVPVPPLAWDDKIPAPHQGTVHSEWKNGRGFEVEDYTGTAVVIDTVEIQGDSVVITCAADPGAGSYVRYAAKPDAAGTQGGLATGRIGQLCDSDPFVGYATKTTQPNYAVSFEKDLP